MHIKLIARALLPGGGMGSAGMVLDLPEAEAKPLVQARLAEPWSMAQLVEPEAPAPVEPDAPAGEGAGAETVAGT